MLCAVDSSFASPSAFYVSLLRSIINLLDASSANLRALLVGTNDYPFSFLQKPEKGLSKQFRCCLQRQGVRRLR